MTSGQRKRAQILQHHKKRHSQPPSHSASHHSHRSQPLPPPPPPPPPTTTNIYHESPHDYLTSTSSSSSLLEPQQHVFSRIKKHPSSSSSSALLQLHENGQLLNMDEDIYDQGDMGDSTVILGTNTDNGEHMMIPSYMAKDFALFPQPTTTYETEITPHNFKGFNAVEQSSLDGLGEFEEDNEIPKHSGKRGAIGNLETLILAEQMENYHRHKPTTYSSATSTSSKIIKNEQLLQQLLQQQQRNNNNEKPEIMNAAAYKSTKQRGHKYRAENDYHSEDDMTETMMYSSKHKPTTIHTSNQDDDEEVVYSGGIKTLTVDDIWSQLQQQYLNKFSPQAQASTSLESEEQSTPYTNTKPKHKRNTKRQRYAKPTITTYPSNSWPLKTLSFAGSSKHNKHQQKQPQYHYNDEIHSLPSAAAFSSSGLLTAHRDKDLFGKRPFNKFTAHDDDDDDTAEVDDDVEEHDEQDEVDIYGDNADNNHDESFEDAVYQSGQKLSSHSAHGQQRYTNNPFNYHDLYGSYSTPVTATIATHIQPSTYHPNLGSSSTTFPTYTGTSTSSFLTDVSQHPSTSYQWRTQQNYPASYQTYHLQHQQQQPQWTPATSTSAAAATEGAGGGRAGGDDEHIVHLSKQHTNAALRLPKASIPQTPNISSSYSKLSPTQSSNDFTVTTSSLSSLTSPSAKSTVQPPPARYKKRKNRMKTKRNRIVVI
ncbi:uncharacterized protein ACRADG_007958 isoform 2-T3 [Cochliomyia hominivorax]